MFAAASCVHVWSARSLSSVAVYPPHTPWYIAPPRLVSEPVHSGAVTVILSPSYMYPTVQLLVDPSLVSVAVYFAPEVSSDVYRIYNAATETLSVIFSVVTLALPPPYFQYQYFVTVAESVSVLVPPDAGMLSGLSFVQW